VGVVTRGVPDVKLMAVPADQAIENPVPAIKLFAFNDLNCERKSWENRSSFLDYYIDFDF